MRQLRRARHLAALLLLPLLAAPGRAHAQQFVTDDAGVVGYRACQLEAWHGEMSSWLLPACQPLRNLELTVGTGRVASNGSRAAEHTLQAKLVLHESATDSGNGIAIAAAGGAGFGPLSQVAGDGVAGAFAYLPVTLTTAADRLLLHINVGWQLERDTHEADGVTHAASHHAGSWAARGDVLLPVGGRATLIGEVYGVDRTRPGFQVGVRTTVIDDRFVLDLSCGGHTTAGVRGAGWTIGAAWTPPPLQ